MLGADNHALRVRLTGPVAPELVAERLATTTSSRLWVEDVPEAAAERRRAAELARPTADLRCVLLRYADGDADLVLVGRRGHSDLRRLAAAASGAEPPEGSWSEPTRPTTSAPAPDWGLGDGRSTPSATHVLTTPTGGDAASWLAALAVTVFRYGSSPILGTDQGAVEFGTLGDLRPAPVDQAVAVGLLYAEDAPGDEYVPCLAPPFPLTVSVGRGRLRCDYLPGGFAPEVVRQFARHLAHVHTQLGAGVSADAVTLLDNAELARVVALGRPAKALVTTPATIPDAFARIAAANPDAVALCDGDTRLTYRELGERADRVASGLRALGVADGDRVGICLERSAELVVTLLGVLKAGAVYVPTDPAYPAERLAYTAEDAQLRVVVTRLPEFPPSAGKPVTPDELDAASTPVTSGVTPEDPAYVIYTSGSTGRPKGVVIPHRNVLALIDATRDEYGLGTGDVWTLFHSSAFDFSVWEIWGCLLTGGRLVVVPYFVSREPETFRDLLVSESVTVLSQTPSAFSQLLEVGHDELAVRLVVFGGEPLDARMLPRWFDRHPESACRLVNMFGITETTVHVTHQTVTRAHALTASRSVGPALPGWHLYVLDPAGRPVPPGVAGEIHVGGAGVALEYLGQPELTARRFVPDPWTGGRMYASGDLGRLRPDGRLDHLGRIDSQVKIRGFRIELDEIRSVLLEDSDVRAAAVVVRREDPADPASARLDAYVVLDGGDSKDTAEIRKRAAGVLPEYMVPATVTALSVLPLTTNGKLDTAKLPEPVKATAAAVAPASPSDGDDQLAEALREVWGEVLGVPIGLDDDFFELGGNSLFAVRIGAALRARGLPSIRLRELYRHPTVRATATALKEAPVGV